DLCGKKIWRQAMKLDTAAIVLALMIFLSLPVSAFGQSNESITRKTVGEPNREEAPTVLQGFKTELFQIKNSDRESLKGIMRGLRSGAEGSEVRSSRDFKTITVRDYPENIAVIGRALSRLDMPEPLPINLEVQLHLIAASRTSKEKSALPKGLD